MSGGGFEEVLTFFCGLCMKICLDVVVDEMNLYILEKECLLQRIGIPTKKFDARMNRIQVAYKRF